MTQESFVYYNTCKVIIGVSCCLVNPPSLLNLRLSSKSIFSHLINTCHSELPQSIGRNKLKENLKHKATKKNNAFPSRRCSSFLPPFCFQRLLSPHSGFTRLFSSLGTESLRFIHLTVFYEVYITVYKTLSFTIIACLSLQSKVIMYTIEQCFTFHALKQCMSSHELDFSII